MQAVDLSKEDIHTYLARQQKKEMLRFSPVMVDLPF